MEVTLYDYTGAGSPDPARHAANVLVFTKHTRLEMTPDLFDEISAWPYSKVEDELEYMANTIPSSWEMVHYNFLINGVTRGFTHQFVRTRTGSYAQQTMRVLNVNGWGYTKGPTLDTEGKDENDQQRDNRLMYESTMSRIADAYEFMTSNGVAIEDARGILPTNITTNICANFSLRTMTDLVRKRSSSRTQGEYREVLEAMKAKILEVHPWAKMFMDRNLDLAASELEGLLGNFETLGHISPTEKVRAVKLIDQMRKG